MRKELLLASLTSAVWLTLSFLCLGFLYDVIGQWVGPLRLMQWEASFGHVQLFRGVHIARVSIWMYGAAVFLAVLPINYYWLRRLRRRTD